MGQWRKNLNARQRRSSRNPAYKPAPSATDVISSLPDIKKVEIKGDEMIVSFVPEKPVDVIFVDVTIPAEEAK